MKLKYYMRGLGIGIVLTTLILSIGNTKEKLSDQEIIKRAKALGMEMKETSNINLDKVLDSIKPSGTPTLQPSLTPAAEPTASPTLEPTATPEPTVTPEPTKEPTAQPTPTEISEVNEDQEGNTEISFTIAKGMSSDRVAKLLVEAGLIENADEFNQYIMKAGKASVISVGTYSLPKGASYDDIIKEITR
jgi:hypothetical protein